MPFESILYRHAGEERARFWEQPAYFKDLNLDQVLSSILQGKEEFSLEGLYRTPLLREEDIRYRQDILKDMGKDPALREALRRFAAGIHKLGGSVSEIRLEMEKGGYAYDNYLQKGRLLLRFQKYCALVKGMAEEFARRGVLSEGLQNFSAYLKGYAASEAFRAFSRETEEVKAGMSRVRYNMLINSDAEIRVRKFEGEADHNQEIDALFSKFKQEDLEDIYDKTHKDLFSEELEAKILEKVKKAMPEPFKKLDAFCEKHGDAIDGTLLRFSTDINFYLAYLDYMAPFQEAGLHFCYPEVKAGVKDIYNNGGFDLALGEQLVKDGARVVGNDFYLAGEERILVVSGPNRGGKTGFARAIGQMHHLASIGCAVPGTSARLQLADMIYTHFESEETVETLSGKLQEELLRMHDILLKATDRSLIIVNEILASTTLKDGLYIGKRLIDQILQKDAVCVWVTFISELADYTPKNVSMQSMILPEDPAQRTFKIERRPADGLAYSIYIAKKHRLTYEDIKGRIQG